jgi:hypothetical protein
MTTPFYNDDTSLTLAGYTELQRLVLGYCTDKGYPPWRFKDGRDNSPDAVGQWRQGLLAALADYLCARVWVQRWTALDGEEKLWLYLSEGEGQAKLKRHGGPIRHRTTLAIIKTQWPPREQPWHTVQVQTAALEELLSNKAGMDELIYQNQENRTAHRQRGGVFTAGAATRVAQGFQAGTQLWVFAPQQQTLDCVVATVGVQALWQASRRISTGHHNRAAQAALPLLRRCHGYRAPAHPASDRATASCQPRGHYSDVRRNYQTPAHRCPTGAVTGLGQKQ